MDDVKGHCPKQGTLPQAGEGRTRADFLAHAKALTKAETVSADRQRRISPNQIGKKHWYIDTDLDGIIIKPS